VLTKNQVVGEITAISGIPTNTVKNVLDALADLAYEELEAGEDFSVPGVVKFSWRYTRAQKKGEKYRKGDTYTGFGGVENVAEADSKARAAAVKLAVLPLGEINKTLKPRKATMGDFMKSKIGKAVAKRKG